MELHHFADSAHNIHSTKDSAWLHFWSSHDGPAWSRVLCNIPTLLMTAKTTLASTRPSFQSAAAKQGCVSLRVPPVAVRWPCRIRSLPRNNQLLEYVPKHFFHCRHYFRCAGEFLTLHIYCFIISLGAVSIKNILSGLLVYYPNSFWTDVFYSILHKIFGGLQSDGYYLNAFFLYFSLRPWHKTGQALWEARQCYPGFVIVSPHYDLYLRFSQLARNIHND